MDEILNIIKDVNLEYKQKKNALASAAENSVPYVNISSTARQYLETRIICDIFEGHAPYRPRYILPDYKLLMEKGSDYLNIAPPTDMYEAINALLIMYNYVPSITGYPVYLGQVDEILKTFADTVSYEELEKLLKLFLINIDRNLPDAFVHMNIGPKDTRVGRLILKLEKELKKAIPNISLKYSDETSKEFVSLAVETALEIGKPYFVNHKEIVKELGEGYGIASCYNTLLIGGGSYTLVRLNLMKLAKKAASLQEFLKEVLPDAVKSLCEIINARASFIVEASRFFESSFLAREGFISIDKFTSMAGVFGLYECVESLTNGFKMGKSDEANAIAEEIIDTIYALVKAEEGAYCYGTNGKLGFHAQSGIDTDFEETAGVRFKVGQEPEIFEQINIQSKLQAKFDTGVTDIYIFESTAKRNINGVLKLIDTAMSKGMKIFALNTSDSDLIRITGYLVKRSDIQKYNNKESMREGTVKLGADSIKNNKVLERTVRNCD